ncbi:Estradiol 17-beta-dehydrogenase 2, partial [Araneus ventricosus]
MSGEGNCNSQPPSKNHPRNENSVAARVGPVAKGNDKLPHFKYEVTLQGLHI